MITLPYVTIAAFKAHPTFLDLLNLRSGNTDLGDQDAELTNVLLMASSWADGFGKQGADIPLGAHTRVENTRVRVGRDGRISYHPDNVPVLALTGLSTGPQPNQLQAITDLSNLWIEDQRQIVGYPGGASAPGMAALQFGTPVAASELYATWSYISGYVNTLLGAPVLAGAASITVADATGITVGSVLRIWDPGSEEAVTVAAGYVPGSTVVPLASALKFAHDPTVSPLGVSGLPPSAHLAVIMYGVALLLRPDTAQDDSFPDSRVSPSTRSADSRKDGSGLVAEAERLLKGLRRVR